MTGTYLLVSDLDGTMLGDDDALQRFARWHEGQRDRILLVYASGRLIESVRDLLASTSLPQPVAIIGGVGTEICWLPKFQSPPDWPRVRCTHWTRELVLSTLADVEDLSLQDDEFQSPWKVSYFYRDASPMQLDSIRQRLREAGVRAELVYSSCRDLDILPEGVHKGAAARFVAKRLRIARRNVIACGDSGNDASLLEWPGYGVIVGNAQDELKQLASSRTYTAAGCYAAGVMEGIHYWLPRMNVEGNLFKRGSFKRR